MNKIKIFSLFILTLMIMHTIMSMNEEHNSDKIIEKIKFQTTQEKIDLCRSLGIEYTHEVTMSKKVHNSLIEQISNPSIQSFLKRHLLYQECLFNQEEYNNFTQDKSASQYMIIKKINQKIGYGIIAAKVFEPGDYLGVYSGNITFQDDTANLAYSFSCNSIIPGFPKLIIDGQYKRNELTFINGSTNHYNCHAQSFLTPTTEKRIVFLATKKIEPGEQILANYGDIYWQADTVIDKYEELGKK